MNWLRRYMLGRYGYDELSKALLALSLLSFVLAYITRVEFLILPSYALLGAVLFRVFSRRLDKRRRENILFMQRLAPVRAAIEKTKRWTRNRRVYRYFTCSGCHQKLRVPRGKGKVRITCPQCRTQTTRKT